MKDLGVMEDLSWKKCSKEMTWQMKDTWVGCKVTNFVTREKLSMPKGKPQQTGMTAEINSIPTFPTTSLGP
jgi:hypothetical protein